MSISLYYFLIGYAETGEYTQATLTNVESGIILYVQGVSDLKDYAEVAGDLRHLQTVKKVELLSIANDALELKISMTKNNIESLDNFLQAIPERWTSQALSHETAANTLFYQWHNTQSQNSIAASAAENDLNNIQPEGRN